MYTKLEIPKENLLEVMQEENCSKAAAIESMTESYRYYQKIPSSIQIKVEII